MSKTLKCEEEEKTDIFQVFIFIIVIIVYIYTYVNDKFNGILN